VEILFVGHASALIKSNGIGLLMDPWLKGTAFNDSWSLYPSAVSGDQLWKDVTHIWFSHEHPDHFSIPTITSIPPAIRAKIHVIFQKHYDTHVLDWLRKQRFASVEEMPHDKWIQLATGFDVSCHQVGHLDSALAVRTPSCNLLNLNDCNSSPATLKRLKKKLGRVDVLMNQFSIAGWPGNPDEHDRRLSSARSVIDGFTSDISALQPRYVLPFASFVRFSHQENSFMNSVVNSVQDVAKIVSDDTLLVMYPGDSWTVGTDHRPTTARALERYRGDAEALTEQELMLHDPHSFEQVLEAANERILDFQKSYHRRVLKYVPPVTFYLTDLQRAFKVDLLSGATMLNATETECHVCLSSQAAHYTFKMRFGLPTLGVSGRYRLNAPETPFRKLKKLGSAYSSGFYTKRLPKFGLKPRLLEFAWRRRRDFASQFFSRII
jgi:UDP-MurNAc hydroxylase